MASDDWQRTACILCYPNCGLEVATEGRAIVRVRGDRENRRSRGYLCQKAQRLPYDGIDGPRLDLVTAHDDGLPITQGESPLNAGSGNR